MKILKKGTPPTKTRIITCLKCKSELEYSNRDIKDNTDPRDNIQDYYIDCPVCKNQILVKRITP